MALFTALVAVVVMLFWRDFMAIAVSNIYLNGIIIGTALFGIGACFVDIFRLLPEYKWLRRLARGERENALPPRLLRPVAIILQNHNAQLSTHTLQGFLDMILLRFDEQRESVRYVTNTLIFLGLLLSRIRI
ncbi:MAG: flagellar motor protein MotA, partial [Alphaproteobacteria bacterium]|nr:flagellar motor protein MotA [Alphaproteobacteria bacterium]